MHEVGRKEEREGDNDKHVRDGGWEGAKEEIFYLLLFSKMWTRIEKNL